MHLSTFEASGFGDALRQSSPPPDFFDNVIHIMTTALSRASDATQALEGISQECCSLGFTGSSTDDVIDDMKAHFRAARIELERAIPGETANVSLEDGKATLSALVQRVKTLANDLKAERDHYNGSLGREKALRGQFDNLLHRYEAAAVKINNLEDSIASSASDMLHTRMRLQDLENEDQEKSIGIDRLNTALDKYHEDVRGLEEMVSRLENENTATKQRYRQKISELRAQLNSERNQRSAIEMSTSENEARIRQLEETVEQNRIRACDLTTEMEVLEKEHQTVLERLEQAASEQQQQHEEDTGTLNVRISELTTSLEGARSEVHRLEQVNNGLEDQLRMEMEARDELLDKWATEQARSFAFMKESVNSERRRAKVRAANWELRSDDLMSDGTTVMGSEPITPVSMTRFVDVEMGRGKNRRRMDSGIGILSEDYLLESEGLVDLSRGVDSDIDLPVSDLLDV
jgi:chromosome segregation ATPase